ILTPLTVYPVYFFFKIIFSATLENTTILVKNTSIEIIKSCVAGSAYYLLLILNLSIPNIEIKKRLKMIAFSFSVLLLINLIRIITMSFLAISNSKFFDITHQITWYILSVLFVIGIWFSEVKIFKIKSIPFYTDMKLLYK
ncbi:MAG: pacearchaeosortase, partial [Candidatus Pacearchaeota archaeon]|nr:pacearchaeosortase [Candidatus Pacearchaeota archaeon]